MKTEPKLTKAEVKSWCPRPRGAQDPGTHARIPGLEYENASSAGKDAENRKLNEEIVKVFRGIKQRDGTDPETGPRFIIQWRIFPNASNANASDPNQCGCGCSCGCS